MGSSFRSRECRDDCSSGSTNWLLTTPLTAAPQWEPHKPLAGIELVGTRTESWEKAAAAAVARASESLRDLRIAEVVELDMHIKDGSVEAYRAKVKVSFKYEGGE